MLSLCSDQDMEGWLEGISSRGHLGLFQNSSVQVICKTEPGPQAKGGQGALPAPPTRRSGGFEPLPAVLPAAFQLLAAGIASFLPAVAPYSCRPSSYSMVTRPA